MSAHTADSGTSVRARSKPQQDSSRKTVYRQVLDNPITVTWPPLPAPTRKAVLDELLSLVASSLTNDGKTVADWRADEYATRRGRNRNAEKGKGKEGSEPSANASATRPTHSLSTRTATYSIPNGLSPTPSSKPAPRPPPELLSHLVVGINEVTRALESRIRWGRWELGDAAAVPGGSAAQATPVPPAPGRHRKRKHTSTPTVLPPSSAALVPPPTLSTLPAYSFLQDPPPSPSPSSLPPYLVPDGSSLRMLVNSDARRLKAPPKPRPAGAPAVAASSPAASSLSSDDPPADALLPTAAASAPPAAEPAPAPAPVDPPPVPLIDLLFVCKPDINPPSLVAHLPTMVAAANGVGEALEGVLRAASDEGKSGKGEMEVDGAEGAARPDMERVMLVPLDAGAEQKLADALGLRRVAAIGLSSSAPGAAALLSLVRTSVTPLTAPWLVPHVLHPSTPSSSSPATASKSAIFAPTTIKHLRTTAPLNPKAAHAEKKKRKREGKEKKREEQRAKRTEEGGKAKSEKGAGVYEAED
ncbi:hypothetical protein JCM10207_004946 [Rhodosporidiobolus poonsookiae]